MANGWGGNGGAISGWGSTGGVGGGSIMGSFQQAQQEAIRANLERYKQGLAIYDEIIGRYKKGGGFVKGAEAKLERAKKKDVAAGMQSLVSSGLAGTTMAAGLGRRWEEEVGEPGRLSIADIAGQRMAQAQVGKAGFIERRQDIGPDPGLVSQLLQQIGTQPIAFAGSGGGGGGGWDSRPLGESMAPQGDRRPTPSGVTLTPRTSRSSTPISWAEPTMGALGKRISYGPEWDKLIK